MNYTKENKNNQSKSENFLHIPSHLDGFTNTDTSKKTIADKEYYYFNGFYLLVKMIEFVLNVVLTCIIIKFIIDLSDKVYCYNL